MLIKSKSWGPSNTFTPVAPAPPKIVVAVKLPGKNCCILLLLLSATYKLPFGAITAFNGKCNSFAPLPLVPVVPAITVPEVAPIVQRKILWFQWSVIIISLPSKLTAQGSLSWLLLVPKVPVPATTVTAFVVASILIILWFALSATYILPAASLQLCTGSLIWLAAVGPTNSVIPLVVDVLLNVVLWLFKNHWTDAPIGNPFKVRVLGLSQGALAVDKVIVGVELIVNDNEAVLSQPLLPTVVK